MQLSNLAFPCRSGSLKLMQNKFQNRTYHHRLYEISISHFPEKNTHNDFSINGRHYYWMSITEMENDTNIMKKNKEVVDFIKENIC